MAKRRRTFRTFSQFIREASAAEKRRVYTEVMKKAIERQRHGLTR